MRFFQYVDSLTSGRNGPSGDVFSSMVIVYEGWKRLMFRKGRRNYMNVLMVWRFGELESTWKEKRVIT